jgi:hypothetical protein
MGQFALEKGFQRSKSLPYVKEESPQRSATGSELLCSLVYIIFNIIYIMRNWAQEPGVAA